MPRPAWEVLSREEVEKFCRDYIEFLDEARTEREVVEYLVSEAERGGFERLSGTRGHLEPEAKVYEEFKGKMFIAAVIGRRPLSQGLRLVAAHADSPRLDLKPVPVGEDESSGLAFFKVGWYGGVVLYQWTNVPLALRGVIVRRDGTRVVVKSDKEGVYFLAPELAPHLSRKRFDERKAREAVKGEEVRPLAANVPDSKAEKNRLRATVLKLLKEKYGVDEQDLLRADLELVPATRPVEVGLDRSMIAAYGQDDRVCVYTAFKALLEIEEPEYTAVFWAVDKEEIGSETNTSAQSLFLQRFLAELMEAAGSFSYRGLLDCLVSTKAVSADVNVAVNPAFKSVYDIENTAKLGYGIVVTKVLSLAGKGGASEPHAEYVAWFTRVLDEAGIPWQPGTLVSKAEAVGGGGTIAKFLARLGMDVVDAGCPLLGMHSPYEVSSKADVYSCYLAYKAFYCAV